jgi:spore germination cell wall hydrolase CwlJ-like protein
MMLALTMWREARGEGVIGMRAVGHVIKNRVDATHLPDKWDDIMTKKWQFSSLTATGDSQLVAWPNSPDPIFEEAMNLADSIFTNMDADITAGATHYFNPGVVLPTWAASMTKIASIGHHDFYR